MIEKPMLAANIDDISVLRYPLVATRKLDGIRCLIINGEARTRSLKLIQNAHIQSLLRQLPDGFDGEIISGDTFQETTSAVMSRDGKPEFTYHVFDWLRDSPHVPYIDRIHRLRKELETQHGHIVAHVRYVEPTIIHDRPALESYLRDMAAAGEEGACFRDPESAYKFGRGTLAKQDLLKFKFFSDAEAEIIDLDEQMENANEAHTDELGRAKRSGHKANMRAKGTLGAFIARDLVTGDTIRVGTGRGLTAVLRQQIWNNKEAYIGRIFKYQHQTVGEKDAPRIPSFQGFRDGSDMS